MAPLFILGVYGNASFMAESFNLDNWGTGQMIGWKTLEVSWLIVEGLLIWVDALEWICLCGICILLYNSIGSQTAEQRTFPLWWARVGLVIALLSFAAFCIDI